MKIILQINMQLNNKIELVAAYVLSKNSQI